MFEAFSRADFVTSVKELADLPSLDPRLTKACGLYSGYCERYQRTPPLQGWAGEVDFDEK